MTVSATVAMQMYLGGAWVDVSHDVDLASSPIQGDYGIKGSGPLDLVASPGMMAFSLNNSIANSGGKAGYYSPDNANARSGFGIGTPVRIAITYKGTTYYKWRGQIDSITPLPGKYGPRMTQVSAVDWLGLAQWYMPQQVALQTNARVDQALPAALASMAIQPAATSYATGAETFDECFDAERDERDPLAGYLSRLAVSELGYIYVKRDTSTGEVLTFESRHTRPLKVTSDATLSGVLNRLELYREANDVRNEINCVVYPRKVDASYVALWSNDKPFSINPGQAVTLTARYRDPNNQATRVRGTSMQTPVADTDYKFGSVQGPTNNDLNASLGITVTFGSNSASISLTNNGTALGYVNLLQLRGYGIYYYNPVTQTAVDATSKTKYGNRPQNVTLYYQGKPLVAADFATYLLGVMKNERSYIRAVGFHANDSDALMTAALSLEPGNRVTLVEDVTGLNSDWFINGVGFTIAPGPLLDFWWQVAPASNAAYWLLGTTGHSELGTTTILGF